MSGCACTNISVAVPCAGIVATMTAADLRRAAKAGRRDGCDGEPGRGVGTVVTLLRRMQVSRPDVVVDAAGTMTVVWSAAGSVTTTRRPAGGNWGRRVVIGHGVAPQAGIDARGTVTVVWIQDKAGFGPQVMAARRTGARTMETAGRDLRRGRGPRPIGSRCLHPEPRRQPWRGRRGDLAAGARGLRGGAGSGQISAGRSRVGTDRHAFPCRGELAGGGDRRLPGRAVVVYTVTRPPSQYGGSRVSGETQSGSGGTSNLPR